MGIQQTKYVNKNLYFRDTIASPYFGQSVWEQFPTLTSVTDPTGFVFRKDDFEYLTIAGSAVAGWTTTAATSGSIVQDTTNPNGVLTISAGAATASQGVNFQLNCSPLKVQANKPVVFEAGFNFSGLTTLSFQAFIGLAATSTALIASGAMAAVQRVGFQGISTTAGVISSVAKAASTAVTGTGLTLVNGTQYRLGIVATTAGVGFYVNGILVSTLTTQIPAGALAPSIVVQANGTVTPVMNLDYVAFGGYR